jgi:aspartate aminotransferase-like enzyme
MVTLWGAVKSLVSPGEHVVCLANGLFGAGFADMARSVGAQVTLLEGDWRRPLDVDRFREHLKNSPPVKLVTAVHCETPRQKRVDFFLSWLKSCFSGVMNSEHVMSTIGELCRRHGALYCVDFVSSAFAAPLSVSKWNIDVGLCGTQKVLSLPPDLGIITMSERAWKAAEERKLEFLGCFIFYVENKNFLVMLGTTLFFRFEGRSRSV